MTTSISPTESSVEFSPILKGILQNPQRLKEFANEEPKVQIKLALGLVKALDEIDSDRFAELVQETNLNKTIEAAQARDTALRKLDQVITALNNSRFKYGEITFANSLIRKLLALRPEQFAQATRGSDQRKLSFSAYQITGLGTSEALENKLAVLDAEPFAQALENTNLRDYLAYLCRGGKAHLALEISRKLLELKPNLLKQALRSDDLDGLFKELRIILPKTDPPSEDLCVQFVNRILDLEPYELVHFAQNTDLAALASTIFSDSEKDIAPTILEKLVRLDPEQLADTIQKTNVGRMISQSGELDGSELAKQLIRKIARLNPELKELTTLSSDKDELSEIATNLGLVVEAKWLRPKEYGNNGGHIEPQSQPARDPNDPDARIQQIAATFEAEGPGLNLGL